MRFGSQKIKIISLVLVFGFIYAVNACAHSNDLQGQFYINNGAPSVPVLFDPSDDSSDDYGNISIGHFARFVPPITNKKTSSNDSCIFTDAGTIITSETASPGKTKTITFKTIGHATQCDADIMYGDKESKHITPITITWKKDQQEVTTITSVTGAGGGSLEDSSFNDWNGQIRYENRYNAMVKVIPFTNNTLEYDSLLYENNPFQDIQKELVSLNTKKDKSLAIVLGGGGYQYCYGHHPLLLE